MNTVKEYLEANHMQTRDNISLIDEFEKEISEMHGSCIDIGCGPGDFTRNHLLPKLPSDATIVGCDISSKMVNYAKVNNTVEGRLSFMELDIETEHFPFNQIGVYDNAFSFFCINWCQDYRKVFRNIHQLLKSNGKSLVLFTADCTTYFEPIIKLRKISKYAPYMEDASKYIPTFHKCENTRRTLRAILEECGFQIIHCSVRDKTFTFENSNAVKKFVQALNPFSKRMPSNLRNEFEEQFLQEFMNAAIVFDKLGQDRKILMEYNLITAYIKKN